MAAKSRGPSSRGCAQKLHGLFSERKKRLKLRRLPRHLLSRPSRRPRRPHQRPIALLLASFDPGTFGSGNTQYTPDKYLQEGFEGSTTRAVSS